MKAKLIDFTKGQGSNGTYRNLELHILGTKKVVKVTLMDNTKTAIVAREIWSRNIVRQLELQTTAPERPTLEYYTKVEGLKETEAKKQLAIDLASTLKEHDKIIESAIGKEIEIFLDQNMGFSNYIPFQRNAAETETVEDETPFSTK